MTLKNVSLSSLRAPIGLLRSLNVAGLDMSGCGGMKIFYNYVYIHPAKPVFNY